MFKKQIKHIKKWNEWRKGCLNSPIYKLQVLFKIKKSPTFEHFWTKEESRAFYEGFMQGLKEAADAKKEQENSEK